MSETLRTGRAIYTAELATCAIDGVTDDQPALAAAIDLSIQQACPLVLSPGIYGLGRPLVVPWNTIIEGSTFSDEAGGLNCSTFRALSGFDTSNNPDGLPAAAIQSNTYTENTGGTSWVNSRLTNFAVDCSLVPGIIGLAIDRPDDHTLIEDIFVDSARSGIVLTGTGGMNKFDRVSVWNCNEGGIRITSHPLWRTGECNGSYHFASICGDNNKLGQVLIEGAGVFVKIDFTRQEGPPTIADNAIRLRNNPNWGSKWTNIANRVMAFGNFNGTVRGSGETANAVVGVESDYNPNGVTVDGWCGFKNWKATLPTTEETTQSRGTVQSRKVP